LTNKIQNNYTVVSHRSNNMRNTLKSKISKFFYEANNDSNISELNRTYNETQLNISNEFNVNSCYNNETMHSL